MSRKQSKTTHTSRGHGVPWRHNFSCGLLSTFYFLENRYRDCLKTSYRCQNKNSHPDGRTGKKILESQTFYVTRRVGLR